MCLIIFVDLFTPVQGCGRTQSLTIEAAHTLLCSAFVHFLVLHDSSLHGIFLWTFIASELFLFISLSVWGHIYPFCLGKWEYVSAGFVCCKMSHHTLDTPRGSTGHGPPAYATRPCTACHSQMGDHQLSMRQKCTCAGASFHAGSCSACRLCICHCLWIFLSHLKHAYACPMCCFSCLEFL